MQNVLSLKSPDVEGIAKELAQRVDQAPHFFLNAPLIIDCEHLAEEQLQILDFDTLKAKVANLAFVPVGIRAIPDEYKDRVVEYGLAVLPDKVAKNQRTSEDTSAKESNNSKQPIDVSNKTTVISRQVRSGQQILEQEGELVILGSTSAGSEVLAAGSIHIYGKVFGRVIAGIHGNLNARIFCQELQAELIAIAGHYLLLDDSKTELLGKPSMIYLEDEQIKVETLPA